MKTKVEYKSDNKAILVSTPSPYRTERALVNRFLQLILYSNITRFQKRRKRSLQMRVYNSRKIA